MARITGVIILVLCISHLVFSQGFTVDGRKLLDAGGEEFVIRGVNHPNAWYIRKGYRSLKHLAKYKTNCVRIVWQTDGKAEELDKILARCIKLEMIPMVELHDFTGDNKIENLMRLVAYYTRDDVKPVLQKYEKHLLLNVANEWGNHTMTGKYWQSSYKQAIDSLRCAGYRYTLVIDAPGWGQDIEPVFTYGQELLDYDPQRNLLFSVHMYFSWNDSTLIGKKLGEVHEMNLPLVVGEFGYNYNNGDNNLDCTVNHNTILRTCHEMNYGYLAWSWAGNNEINRWLDMSNNWRKLNKWGREVFESEFGIKNTARKASVFIPDVSE